jgi:hypothetical protein
VCLFGGRVQGGDDDVDDLELCERGEYVRPGRWCNLHGLALPANEHGQVERDPIGGNICEVRGKYGPGAFQGGLKQVGQTG